MWMVVFCPDSRHAWNKKAARGTDGAAFLLVEQSFRRILNINTHPLAHSDGRREHLDLRLLHFEGGY